MPSFTTPPQSSLQGHGELTLPAAISAWAHPLHKSLLFSFVHALTLCMHLHVFSQRNSVSIGSIWHFPFNSFKQYLFVRFGVWLRYLGQINILSLHLCFREANQESVIRRSPPKQAHKSVWHSAVGWPLLPFRDINSLMSVGCASVGTDRQFNSIYAIKSITAF